MEIKQKIIGKIHGTGSDKGLLRRKSNYAELRKTNHNFQNVQINLTLQPQEVF